MSTRAGVMGDEGYAGRVMEKRGGGGIRVTSALSALALASAAAFSAASC